MYFKPLEMALNLDTSEVILMVWGVGVFLSLDVTSPWVKKGRRLLGIKQSWNKILQALASQFGCK